MHTAIFSENSTSEQEQKGPSEDNIFHDTCNIQGQYKATYR
jgi:hypothetical protein